jgi:hypothetical protein
MCSRFSQKSSFSFERFTDKAQTQCLFDWAQGQLEATGDDEVKCPMNPEDLDGNAAAQCVYDSCSVLDSLGE